MFERLFKEGMALVEETAAYLDGPGRAASKELPRLTALAYASESMRLTTRLMQAASWLLVQRAVREDELSVSEAAHERYRLTLRSEPASLSLVNPDELPAGLRALIAQGEALFERVRRMDADMYDAGADGGTPGSVEDHFNRLRAAFGEGL